eukprot:CAMPEP_0176168808 /NCGR_PEP_ID=MMETSP0120_2-20121206/86405_1 /TAXON_ID=160619 /ORGANISM="Kryptoperidinium foliaceum, Strain CCMP 1326" /LENGTH=43 /DNA_ID= /DNA_START= /DNA_END= /DNA_ORIENTATION=
MPGNAAGAGAAGMSATASVCSKSSSGGRLRGTWPHSPRSVSGG